VQVAQLADQVREGEQPEHAEQPEQQPGQRALLQLR
jgi:hypothetical protein